MGEAVGALLTPACSLSLNARLSVSVSARLCVRQSVCLSPWERVRACHSCIPRPAPRGVGDGVTKGHPRGAPLDPHIQALCGYPRGTGPFVANPWVCTGYMDL